MPALFETMRPKSWSEVVGQPKAITTLQRMEGAGGFGGRALWFSGASGTGKTTMARLAALTLADPACVMEYDTADDLTAAELESIDRTSRMYGWGKGGRAFIVNESHGLRKQTIRTLLGMLERIPSHVLWAFTTTRDGEDGLFEDQIDASPLLSRCIRVPLTNQGLAKTFAPILLGKARELGLDGKPEAAYVALMQECKNNVRAAWQAIESGRMLA